MAPPVASTTLIPTLLLVVDGTLRLRAYDAPEHMRLHLAEAADAATPIDALPWGNPGDLRSAVYAALRGSRQEFSALRFGHLEFEGVIVPLPGPPGEAVVIAGGDFAELHELRQALRQAEELTSSAYFVLDVDAMAVNVTPSFAQLWGFNPDATRIAFSEITERVLAEDRDHFVRQQSPVNGETPLLLDYRITHPESGLRHLRTRGSYLRDSDGRIQRIVGTVVDLTEQIAARDTAEFLTTHDALTGLWNRHFFIDALEQISELSGLKASLIIIDIDRFSQINEVAGHDAGDALLRSVADRLRFLGDLGHYVTRLGGDEFACLLFEREGSFDGERIIENLRQRLEVPFVIGEAHFELHSTFGVAEYPKDGGGQLLLQNAGIALLSAKTSARGSVVRYHADLERRLSNRSRIERDLTHAIERDEFEMFYQPVINAESGELVATEALLRWKHPELGLLLPDSFLNVAEESDHVVNIGRWAIERACRDAVSIQASLKRALRLNVNVSPRHVQSSALIDDVESALAASGWDAGHLQLEVTEQLLINDVPSAASTLSHLRSKGVTVAIDDFGTGYNTLSYLKSYPVSCIKIDRAFVRDSESDDYSRAICRSVTALAESLDMNLIGEGVETVGQASFLRNIGCLELQGYHFGRPIALGEFIAAHG